MAEERAIEFSQKDYTELQELLQATHRTIASLYLEDIRPTTERANHLIQLTIAASKDKAVLVKLPRIPHESTTWTEGSDGEWTCFECELVYLFVDEGPEQNDTQYCPKCGRLIIEFVKFKIEEEQEDVDE